MNPEFEELKLPTEDTHPEEVVAITSKQRLLLGTAITITTIGLLGIVAYVAYVTLTATPTPTTDEPDETAFLSDEDIQEIRRNLSPDTSGIDPLLSEAERAVIEAQRVPTYVDASGTTVVTPLSPNESADSEPAGDASVTNPDVTTSDNTSTPTNNGGIRPSAQPASATTNITSNDDSLVVVGEVTVTNTDQLGDPIAVTERGILRLIDTTNNVFTMGFIGGDVFQVAATPQTEIIIGGQRASFSQLTPDDILEVVGFGHENSVNILATRITVTGVYEAMPLDE